MKKCFIVYMENGKQYTDEIDTAADIVFTKGPFLEYETIDACISIDIDNVIKIYFE